MDMAEDVVFCILLWLPVTTLLRFKVVCKSWRSVIESRDFVAKHLHHNHQDDDSWDLITLSDLIGVPSSCLREDLSDEQELFHDVDFTFLSGTNFQFSRHSGFTFKSQTRTRRVEIMTSCDGIILLNLEPNGYSHSIVDNSYNPDIALWNPATRQFKTLPPAPVGVPIDDQISSGCLTYGLGFDVKTNDYKVVRILIDFLGESHYTTPVKSRTDVYSLSANSWKTVDAGVLPVHSVWQNPRVPFRNGIYCWIGAYDPVVTPDVFGNKNLIFSFDFGSEEFGTIPLPDVVGYVITSEMRVILSFLKENIACLIRGPYYPQEDPTTDVWVLKQYGVADSWSKLYTIKLENFWRPSGLSKNGKIFSGEKMPTNGMKLILSDPVTHESNIFPIESYFRLQVAHYKESLVSIKSANGANAIENDKHVVFF